MTVPADSCLLTRADLHVHSEHSMRGDRLFNAAGVPAAYADVESIYRQAKARGMDFVTITDHNTIEGARELVARHPEDCFVSVETTASFPEEGGDVHLLIFDLQPPQFESIQRLRQDIYRLRDYLCEQSLAHSVAHASFNVDGRLTTDTLERLLLLFNVFEGMGGAHPESCGQAWLETLRGLSADHLDRLRRKHHIEPTGPQPWIKGLTGGSNDRSGILTGQAYTLGEGDDRSAFLRCIKERRTRTGGRGGDHRSLAIAIHQSALRFSRHASLELSGGTIWEIIDRSAADKIRRGPARWFVNCKLRRAQSAARRFFTETYDGLTAGVANGEEGATDPVDEIFSRLTNMSDDFFSSLARKVSKEFRKPDAAALLRGVLTVLPMTFLAFPLYRTLKHLHGHRHVQMGSPGGGPGHGEKRDRRLLWFSDTVKDLNGVSVTLRELAHRAHTTERNLHLVTCLGDDESRDGLPPNVLYLPCIESLLPKFYDGFALRVPSFLRALDVVMSHEPEEIIISTPGPVGIIGLFVARLLEIPSSGIYHTDLTSQFDQIIAQEPAPALIECYAHGFFRLMDRLRVPTEQYIAMLTARGLDRGSMTLFRRGIDESFLSLNTGRQDAIRARHGLNGNPVLLWAGRMGKEKNLAFLLEVFSDVQRLRPDTRLLMVGEGPERATLQRATARNPAVILVDRVDRSALADYYSIADVFVFPSTTDTFGMVVLEAQSCGTPVLVTNIGGPQELVSDGRTGYVLESGNAHAWAAAIVDLIDRKRRDPAAYEALRATIRNASKPTYGWDHVLDDVMGPKGQVGPKGQEQEQAFA